MTNPSETLYQFLRRRHLEDLAKLRAISRNISRDSPSLGRTVDLLRQRIQRSLATLRKDKRELQNDRNE
jgi:hypothetical protein